MIANVALQPSTFKVDYGRDIEREIRNLAERIAAHPTLSQRYNPRWLAIKLLEGEDDLIQRVALEPDGNSILEHAAESRRRIQRLYHDSPDILIADRRYGFISGLTRQVMQRPAQDRLTLTDRIDQIAASRWLGIPIFLAMMYILFELVVNVSSPFLDWVDAVFTGPITRWTLLALRAFSAPDWLQSLAVEGIIAGVGGIMTFLPGLIILYIFLAVLEDSGYMARAAFVMDKTMRIFGLHGKAFIPMILGFGCNVPAVYATRTMENYRDRLLTALLIPFMSCSARLPVYVVFGLAFFPKRVSLLIWGLYTLGIFSALATSFVAQKLFLKNMPPSLFVLELPPYRLPTWRSIWIHTWEHTREFVTKAGTIILIISIILWILLNMPWGVQTPHDSWFGYLSGAIAPAFQPLGFGTWEASGALISGFVAKEVVVSTMSQIYVGTEAEQLSTAGSLREDVDIIVGGFLRAVAESIRRLVDMFPGVHVDSGSGEEGEPSLVVALRSAFTPPAALAFVVFVLLYVPCMATVAAIRQEFGGRWALFSIGYQLTIAWMLAFLAYHVAMWLG